MIKEKKKQEKEGDFLNCHYVKNHIHLSYKARYKRQGKAVQIQCLQEVVSLLHRVEGEELCTHMACFADRYTVREKPC